MYYLARLHRETKYYSKSTEMLRFSILLFLNKDIITVFSCRSRTGTIGCYCTENNASKMIVLGILNSDWQRSSRESYMNGPIHFQLFLSQG